jgi:gluconate 2-dehydrogenase gamma chain
MNSSRRSLLFNALALGAWAEIAAARQHAHVAMRSADTAAFQILDPAIAAEIEAITGQIIPSSDGPGAREAGVIYFVDRALATFASDERDSYSAGMAAIEKRREELFPNSSTIASLSSDQQIALIKAIEQTEFFDLLRTHTVLGFLADPTYGGNRNQAGWKYIGFDSRMAYEPPFGYYDAQQSGGSK